MLEKSDVRVAAGLLSSARWRVGTAQTRTPVVTHVVAMVRVMPWRKGSSSTRCGDLNSVGYQARAVGYVAAMCCVVASSGLEFVWF